MSETQQLHLFRLYRSGWSEGAPWDDNQLWAQGRRVIDADETYLTLEPVYGSAASWYRLGLQPLESPEPDWVSYSVELTIDSQRVGGAPLPLAWYVGAPADWPSGLARFPETYGPPLDPRVRSTFPQDGPRGIWTLAVMRVR